MSLFVIALALYHHGSKFFARHGGLIFGLLVLVGVRFSPEQYHSQQLFLSLIMCVIIAWGLRGVYRPPLLLVGIYLASMLMWLACFGRGAHPNVWAVATHFTAKMTVYTFLMVVGLSVVRVDVPRILRWAVPIVCASTLLGHGFIYNDSLNSAFLVACLPFVPWAFPIVAWVVLRTAPGGATGPIMLSAYLFLFCLQKMKRKFWGGFIGGLLGGSFLFGKYVINTAIFNESVRFEFYKMVWEFFREHTVQWHGIGFGAFVGYGPLLQQLKGYQVKQWWLSVHSDVLQVLVENGWVGLGLALLLYFDSVRRSEPRVMVALLLMGICAIGYFPMEVPIMALYGVWLVLQTQLKAR